MAEILLSLTIIGVVAAITLPSLTGNINERTWNTQRKAFYARMSQAISLMPALNGYGVLVEGDPNNVAETFVTNGLSKVLKINNICDNEHLTDCGIPEKMIAINGSSVVTPKDLVNLNFWLVGSRSNETGSFIFYSSKAVGFETNNGESVLTFYNPQCVGSLNETGLDSNGFSNKAEIFFASKMCVNFIFDMNGAKGPNTMGKDIGIMTVFSPSDPIVVAPAPATKGWDTPYSMKNQEAVRACPNMNADYRLPNREEAASIKINANLVNGDLLKASGQSFTWSSSRVLGNTTRYWMVTAHSWLFYPATYSFPIWCIKR